MEKIIDISENNGDIDFSKLKDAGINGVIIRIGWIGNKNNHTLDKRFIEYYNKAKNHGLKVGFYVFSYCISLDAMKNATEWVKNKLIGKAFELPVFLDLEDDARSGTVISKCGKENLTEQALYFCNNLYNSGLEVGVYANKDWFNRLIDINKLLNFKIWFAEWGVENPSVNYRVDFWQYTSDGHLPRN